MLDSVRCISYLTIELKGPIPSELHAAMANHVYGCDICQDVCPYNEAAPRSADPAWQPRSAFNRPALSALWQMPDGELRALMKGSPMTRARVAGLRRNLEVALGNCREFKNHNSGFET